MEARVSFHRVYEPFGDGKDWFINTLVTEGTKLLLSIRDLWVA